MMPAWSYAGWLGLALLVCVGCRTAPPKVEPAKQPDTLNIPPVGDARYDSSQYPEQAMASKNKNKRLYDDSPIVPAKGGGMGGSGMGGMGGFR